MEHKQSAAFFWSDIDKNGMPKILSDLGVFILPPYYMPALESFGIKVLHPEFKGLEQSQVWAIEFLLLIKNCFADYHSSPFGDEDEVISISTDALDILYKSFRLALRTRAKIQPTQLVDQVTHWVNMTSQIVRWAFTNDILVKDGFDKRRSSARLFSELNALLNKLVDSFLEVELREKFSKISNVVLYNLWGDNHKDLLGSAQDSLPLSTDEKAATSIQDNKRRFFDNLYLSIKESSLELTESAFFKQCETISSYIASLFKDYFIRLRKSRLQDIDAYHFACTYWEVVTEQIILRCFVSLIAEYLVEIKKGKIKTVLSPSVDGEEMYYHNRAAVITKRLLDTVKTICDEFDERIGSDVVSPWNERLLKLNIDYDYLYLNLKEKLFTGVSLGSFKQSIQEADFKSIKAAKTNSIGVTGGLNYLISQLGYKLGKEWFEKASLSVCEGKTIESATKYVRGGHPSDMTEYVKTVLEKGIPSFKVVEKTTRNRA